MGVLQKCETRLLRVQQGEVTLGGEVLADAQRSPPPEARPVGLVFQDGALFPHMTLAANVAFGLPKARRVEADSWLAKVGLAGMGARYPHELSGGQQQRAALARAMAPEPRVLLMDEPFAALDEITRQKLNNDLLTLKAKIGCTVIFVTHSVEEAVLLSDRVVVMSNISFSAGSRSIRADCESAESATARIQISCWIRLADARCSFAASRSGSARYTASRASR